MNAFGVRNDGGVEREHRICNGNSAFGNGLLTNLRCEIRPEEGEKRARKRILTELRIIVVDCQISFRYGRRMMTD